jgi:hypothetical protein
MVAWDLKACNGLLLLSESLLRGRDLIRPLGGLALECDWRPDELRGDRCKGFLFPSFSSLSCMSIVLRIGSSGLGFVSDCIRGPSGSQEEQCEE